MALYCSMMRYTPEALMQIARNREDRSEMARRTIESAGGTFHGMYGMLGQSHHVMVIAEMPDISDHLSVLMKVLDGGSISDIKTITLFSGQDVVAAADKLASGGIDYQPVRG